MNLCLLERIEAHEKQVCSCKQRHVHRAVSRRGSCDDDTPAGVPLGPSTHMAKSGLPTQTQN